MLSFVVMRKMWRNLEHDWKLFFPINKFEHPVIVSTGEDVPGQALRMHHHHLNVTQSNTTLSTNLHHGSKSPGSIASTSLLLQGDG